MEDNYFKNKHVEMWLEDGILYSVHAEKVSINLEIAKICVEARLKLSKGQTYPILTDARNVVSFDKPARDFLAKGDAIKYISAGAFLVRNEIQRFLGNLWFSISNPAIPSKLFTDKESALKWLSHYKNLN